MRRTDGGDDSRGQSTDEDNGPSSAEKAVMVVSVLATVAIFGIAVGQLVSAPAASQPAAEIVDTETTSAGDVILTVELRNRLSVGLLSATVEVECADPPPELQFRNVPRGGHRQGRVVCPPDTDNPNVTVSTWMER